MRPAESTTAARTPLVPTPRDSLGSYRSGAYEPELGLIYASDRGVPGFGGSPGPNTAWSAELDQWVSTLYRMSSRIY